MPSPTLGVVEHLKLTGGAHWDYLALDAAGKCLFITRDDHVDVIDPDSGKISAVIPGMKGVHGVALAEDLNRGYASNGSGNSVTSFELDSLKVIKEASVPGQNPDAILYEPTFKHVFTFNGRSKDATVLDPSNLSMVATIPLSDKRNFAVHDGAGRIFVNIESEGGKISVIDGAKFAVKATWSLPGCASPTGLAIDKKKDSVDHYTVVQNLTTKLGARTMALDPLRDRVYLVTSDFGPPQPATAAAPAGRPSIIAGSLEVLVVGAL